MSKQNQTRFVAVAATALLGARVYEIAVYGSLVTYAKAPKLKGVVKLLTAPLKEEKETDVTLSELAGQLNFEAEEQDD